VGVASRLIRYRELTHTRVELCVVISRTGTNLPLLPPPHTPLFAIMPKIKSRSRCLDGLDDLLEGRSLAVPRAIGKIGRGAKLRSPVLRAIGTRLHPLSENRLVTPMERPSGARGDPDSVHEKDISVAGALSGNPFASLRVSVPG
jgi:hypothetical protein